MPCAHCLPMPSGSGGGGPPLPPQNHPLPSTRTRGNSRELLPEPGSVPAVPPPSVGHEGGRGQCPGLSPARAMASLQALLPRPPLHSNTCVTGRGAPLPQPRQQHPEASLPTGAKEELVKPPSFTPIAVKTPQQQLSATTLCPLHPSPGTQDRWGPWHGWHHGSVTLAPPSPTSRHAGPGSRQRGQQDSGKGPGTDGGSHRRTDIRGIFFFLQRQRPGATGTGRVLSMVLGRVLTATSSPSLSHSPRGGQRAPGSAQVRGRWDPEMAPCPQLLLIKCVGAAVPGRGAAGRAGAGPENSPRPRGVGQSAGGATWALPHGSALAARGGHPGPGAR